MAEPITSRRRPKGRRPLTKKQQQEREHEKAVLEALTGNVAEGDVVAQDVRAEIQAEIAELDSDKSQLAQKYMKGSQKRYYAALAMVMRAADRFYNRIPAERQVFLKSLTGERPRKGHSIEHILLDYMIQYGGGPGTADASRKLLSRDAKALQQARHLGMTADEFAERCGKGEAGLDVLARTHSQRLKREKLDREGKVEEAKEVGDRISLAARVPIELKASRTEKQTRFLAVISCEAEGGKLKAKVASMRRLKQLEGLPDAELDDFLCGIEDLFSGSERRR